MIANLIDALRLCIAISGLPEVAPADAARAAIVIAHVHAEYEPALIGAIMWGESRGVLDVVSRDGKDCGSMGVRTRSPARCRRLRRDEWYSYRAGVEKLRAAREFCGWRGDATLACAIAGYQGGPTGVRAYERGATWTTTRRRELLDRAAWIRARVNGWQVAAPVRAESAAEASSGERGVRGGLS